MAVRVDRQLLEQLGRLRVRCITCGNICKPSRSGNGYSLELGWRVGMMRQGIGCRIGCAGLVNYPVLKTDQFGVHLELPLGLQALISEVHEAALVSKDGKFVVLEI